MVSDLHKKVVGVFLAVYELYFSVFALSAWQEKHKKKINSMIKQKIVNIQYINITYDYILFILKGLIYLALLFNTVYDL